MDHRETARAITDALIQSQMPGRHKDVVHALVRMTFGFGKPRDTVAAQQLVLRTHIAGRHVRTILGDLETWGVIRRGPVGGGRARVMEVLDPAGWAARAALRSQPAADPTKAGTAPSAGRGETRTGRGRGADRPAHGAATAPYTGRKDSGPPRRRGGHRPVYGAERILDRPVGGPLLREEEEKRERESCNDTRPDAARAASAAAPDSLTPWRDCVPESWRESPELDAWLRRHLVKAEGWARAELPDAASERRVHAKMRERLVTYAAWEKNPPSPPAASARMGPRRASPPPTADAQAEAERLIAAGIEVTAREIDVHRRERGLPWRVVLEVHDWWLAHPVPGDYAQGFERAHTAVNAATVQAAREERRQLRLIG